MEMEDRLEAGSLIRLVKTDSLTAQAFSLKCRYVLGRKDDCLKIIGPNIEEISRVTLRHDKNMTFGGWLAWNEAQSSLVLSHSRRREIAADYPAEHAILVCGRLSSSMLSEHRSRVTLADLASVSGRAKVLETQQTLP